MAAFRYCLITDRKVYSESLVDVARKAEESGIHYFHLREKDLSSHELLKLAGQIRKVLQRTRFIVNGRLDVCNTVGADGVHLQKDNLPVSAVRSKFPDLEIGYSAHSREEALEAENAGASYVFLSPVFETISKKSTLPVIGLPVLREWISALRIPIFGLGGVDSSNVAALSRSGCSGAAGISMFINDGMFTSKGMVL